MEFYQVTSEDLEGIVSQLRNTKGVEAAIFLYESGNQEYRVSMRSNGNVDVCTVASYFGGGVPCDFWKNVLQKTERFFPAVF